MTTPCWPRRHGRGQGRAAVEALKAELRGAARHPAGLPESSRCLRPRTRMAGQRAAGLAEQAVWELLHQGRPASWWGADGAIEAERWQALF